MMSPIASRLLSRSALMIIWALVGSMVKADSISSYQATDLGTAQYDYGNEPKLSSTGSNGTLTTSSGTVYAFPRTDNLVTNPTSLFDALPPFTNSPFYDSSTNNNSHYGYSHFATNNVFLNKAGEFVATDIIGVGGLSFLSQSLVYTTARQPDGSFGPVTNQSDYSHSPLAPLWSTDANYRSGETVALAVDLNNVGKVLGIDSGINENDYYRRDEFVYDLHTKLRTELTSLLPKVGPGPEQSPSTTKGGFSWRPIR